MSFDNDTNRKRVAKIVETLELISKSAQSNKASYEEVQPLVQPALDVLTDLVGAPAEPEVEVKPNFTPRKDIQIREMAREADLKDLTMAMAIYLDRIDELLH